MLPIIDGGKKKYAISYSFHLDTGDIARKAGEQIQEVAKRGYAEASRFLRRKYRALKVKKALGNMRKDLSRRIKLYLPINLKSLKSHVREIVHA
jgi:hypothetical protein